jgi:hypothetical protein
MRSDEPWRCGGRAWPGLSLIILTLDCEPSMSGCAINFSLSYAGMSLSLTMSTTVGIARRGTDHERLPRFDAPALLECIPVSRPVHESLCSHHSAIFLFVSDSPWETTINDERLKIHDSGGPNRGGSRPIFSRTSQPGPSSARRRVHPTSPARLRPSLAGHRCKHVSGVVRRRRRPPFGDRFDGGVSLEHRSNHE